MPSPIETPPRRSDHESRLAAAFRDHGQTATHDRLAIAVSGYVHAMKTQGMTAERVIINLNRIARLGFIEPTRFLYWNGESNAKKDEIIAGAVSVGLGLFFRTTQYA